MKTINFHKLEVFTDIGKKHCQIVDVSRQLAESLYSNGRGLVSYALALKIYNANDAVELNEEECDIIRTLLNEGGSPAIIDAIETAFKDYNEDGQNS